MRSSMNSPACRAEIRLMYPRITQDSNHVGMGNLNLPIRFGNVMKPGRDCQESRRPMLTLSSEIKPSLS